MFKFNRYGIDWDNDRTYTRVLKILQYHKGEVNVWKLINASKVCHYTEAIRILRNKGYIIGNRTEHKGRVMHSYYHLKTN